MARTRLDAKQRQFIAEYIKNGGTEQQFNEELKSRGKEPIDFNNLDFGPSTLDKVSVGVQRFAQGAADLAQQGIEGVADFARGHTAATADLVHTGASLLGADSLTSYNPQQGAETVASIKPSDPASTAFSAGKLFGYVLPSAAAGAGVASGAAKLASAASKSKLAAGAAKLFGSKLGIATGGGIIGGYGPELFGYAKDAAVAAKEKAEEVLN